MTKKQWKRLRRWRKFQNWAGDYIWIPTQSEMIALLLVGLMALMVVGVLLPSTRIYIIVFLLLLLLPPLWLLGIMMRNHTKNK